MQFINIGKKIAFILFFVATLYFFWKTISNNYQAVLEYNFSFDIWFLLLSILIYILFYISLTWLWYILLPEREKVLKKEILYINTISWISKYLPGKVAMIITKVLYLEKKGISKRRSLISCIYEHIFQIIASLVVSFPFIFWYFLGTQESNYIILSGLFFIGFLIFIHPKVFNPLLNIGFRLLKKEPVHENEFLWFLSIIQYLAWYCISMIIKWFSFVFLVMSMTSIWIWDVSFLLFAWIFAWVVGIVSIFAPNGLGVREWVLVFLLSFILPVEIAIIISVVSRLWSTLCDWLIWLYIPWFNMNKKNNLL